MNALPPPFAWIMCRGAFAGAPINYTLSRALNVSAQFMLQPEIPLRKPNTLVYPLAASNTYPARIPMGGQPMRGILQSDRSVQQWPPAVPQPFA